MRTRQAIEETFKDVTYQSGDEWVRIQLELLMDIRELLLNMEVDRKLEQTIRSRIMISKQRENA
jgi:hypothetical protein